MTSSSPPSATGPSGSAPPASSRQAWLPLACDPGVHRKHDVAKQYDISFVGRFCPGPLNELLDLLRHKIASHLVRQGYFDKTARICSGQSFGSTAGPQVVFGYDPGGRVTTMTRTIGPAPISPRRSRTIW